MTFVNVVQTNDAATDISGFQMPCSAQFCAWQLILYIAVYDRNTLIF